MPLLPETKTPPVTELGKFVTVVYGPPKIGKSTLASQFDAPLFLATEPGLHSLETFQVPVTDWETFITACAEIASGKHAFKTIVIDTVDNLFRFCSAYICKKHGITHESDLEWGKGWKFVKDEFFRAMTKLAMLPYGLVIVSHADTEEIKSRTGTITRWMPTMPKQAREIILPMADFVLFATSIMNEEGEYRILHTKPSENWEAGDRTGLLPAEIELSFKAFADAFATAMKQKKTNKKGA